MAHDTTRKLLLAGALVVCLLGVATAQDATAPAFSSPSTVPSTGDIAGTSSSFGFNPFSSTGSLTVSSVIVAVINIILGIVLCFFGIRVFRLVIFLAGAYFFAVVAFIVLTNMEPSGGYDVGISRELFYGLIMLGAALVGGFLSVCLWQLGLVLLGAAGGVVLALFIQSLRPGGLITNQIGLWVFLGVLGLAGALLAFFLENHLIIIFTAILGSNSIFTGIDAFVHTGYAGLVSGFVSTRTANAYAIDGKLAGMLAGFAATALLGIILQYRTHDRKTHGVNQVRRRPRAQAAQAYPYGYAPIKAT